MHFLEEEDILSFKARPQLQVPGTVRGVGAMPCFLLHFFFLFYLLHLFSMQTLLVSLLSLSGTGLLSFATIDIWGHNTFAERFIWKTDENSQDNFEEAKHNQV